MEELSGPKATREMLGDVALSESGSQDPMKPAHRAIVAPRARATGGEAIAITLAASAGGPPFADGTGTTYMVHRHEPQPSYAVQ